MEYIESHPSSVMVFKFLVAQELANSHVTRRIRREAAINLTTCDLFFVVQLTVNEI
jgi:hypothetical protein